MFSIGEFSRVSGLTVTTLRFYHERGLLVPAAVDPQTGYWYYDQSNLEVAYIIASLRDFEFTLEEIAQILDEHRNGRQVLTYLERQRDVLREQVQRYRELLLSIDQAIHQESEVTGMRATTHEIQERTIEPQLVAGYRMKGRYRDCGTGFGKIAKLVGRYINGKPPASITMANTRKKMLTLNHVFR